MFQSENWDMQSASEAEPAPGRGLELRCGRTFDACQLWVVAVTEETLPDIWWVLEPEPLLASAAAA
jgi:hypothetical protein